MPAGGEGDVLPKQQGEGKWHARPQCFEAQFREVAGIQVSTATVARGIEGNAMAYLDVSRITSWHAHVYFDAAKRNDAWRFREAVTAQFGNTVEMGRFHERPVGPHPQWSFQIAFEPAQFSGVVGWLALNHGALDLFVHPNTDDELRDHRDCAIWLGRSYQLDLRAVGG